MAIRRSIGPKKQRTWRSVALEKNLNLTEVHPWSTETGLATMIALESQDIQVKEGSRSELPVIVSKGTIFMVKLPSSVEDKLEASSYTT